MDTVTRFVTANRRLIYAIPVRSFPNLTTNLFVISDGQNLTLVDCGSGAFHSSDDLVAGLERIGELYGEAIRLSDLTAILITHGHIDHFGGLNFVRQHNPNAPIGVHMLDRRVLSHHEERVVFAVSRLQAFLETAGVPTEQRDALLRAYTFAKAIYKSVPVQFCLEEGQPVLGLQVYHVPGHCAGLVCLQVDDILLTADHILSRTTPHQAPESITRNMGLGHYFDSLAKIARLDGVRLGLGSHEDPMPDVPARVQAIRQLHEARLERVLELCVQPATIASISLGLFGRVKDYHILLALEEAGAHVEYLYERGLLVASNVEEIERAPHAPVQYIRT